MPIASPGKLSELRAGGNRDECSEIQGFLLKVSASFSCRFFEKMGNIRPGPAVGLPRKGKIPCKMFVL